MKAAILGPAYPFRGGIAKHTGLLFKKLCESGIETALFSFRKQFPKFLFPGATQFDKSAHSDEFQSERIFIPWSPLSWIKTAQKIRDYNPEILICVWWTPFTALGYWTVCKMVKRSSHTKIVFLLHNVIPHEGMPFKTVLSKLALGLADGFIAQSGKVEAELVEAAPSTVNKWRRIVPHPTYDFQDYACFDSETARMKLGISESRALLFFGIVRKYKGLGILIQAFPRIHRHFNGDIRLIIAGEFYDEPEIYTAMIEQSGLADKITIQNQYIPNEEVGLYFAAADVVVLPYISASQSGIVQTAFGFDKPVISTEVGGLPEVITSRETGLLCPPNDPEKLAETVIQFYELSKTVNWQDNIEREKARFSWDNMTEAVEEFAAESTPRPGLRSEEEASQF